MFTLLEKQITTLIRGYLTGVRLFYTDAVNPQNSFELDTEYQGRMVKALVKSLGALNQPRDRHARGQRAPAFP